MNEIFYKPSIVARIARLIIPILKFLLPKSLFSFFYNFLYFSYKKSIRVLYFTKVIWFFIFGSNIQKLKSNWTFKLLPYTMGGVKALENAFDIIYEVEKKNIEGAIVECGVAEGGTSAMMAITSKLFTSNIRQKWMFDSYEGLPDPTEDDYINGKTGVFIRPLPKGSCLGTVEQVSELIFHHLGFPDNEIHLIKGWFQDTLPIYKNKIGKIAVLRLDGDWYESTIVPLKNLFDLVVCGGYVIVDDYATCYGSKKALDEFLELNSLNVILNEDGRGGIWFEKKM